MKIIHNSSLRLLHLLLLAELFVHSSSHPVSLCSMFKSMTHQMDRVIHFAKMLPDLTDDELTQFNGAGSRLDGLPHLQHDFSFFSSLKVNESLSQLYEYTQSFRLHVEWLKTVKENKTSAEGASTHLQHLSKLINASLHQISEEVPPTPSATFPVIATEFDVLQVSIEISKRLKVFCDWSKRVLRVLAKQSHCPRH